MNKIRNILIGASLLTLGWAEGRTGIVKDFCVKYRVVEIQGRYYCNGYDLNKFFEKREDKSERGRAKAKIEQFAQTMGCTQREAVDLFIVADDTGRLASERSWLYSLCDD